jgi:hypothetical protein
MKNRVSLKLIAPIIGLFIASATFGQDKQEISIEMAEQIFKSSMTQIISTLETNGFKNLKFAEMKEEEPDLTKDLIFFSNGKQKNYWFRKSKTFGANKVDILMLENLKSVDAVSWNEHIRFAGTYANQFRSLGYKEVNDGYSLYYENHDKKIQILTVIDQRRNEIRFVLSKLNL